MVAGIDTNNSQERWRKAELHSHCNLDPIDYRICPYSAEELIAEAARLGYEILAITCHDSDIWTHDLSMYAAKYGITLVPGMEVTNGGMRHTLAYNFGTCADNLNSFEKIRALSRPDTLVIAAHPYFPGIKCLHRLLERNLDVFDAIEVSGFHTPGIDFNRRARRLAAARAKPLVGNGDVHQLWQLGRTYTWVHCGPGIASILRAIKEGRVRVESTAITYTEAINWWVTAIWRIIFSPLPQGAGRIPQPLLNRAAKERATKVAG